MSGMAKAEKFAAEAKANGWGTKIEIKNGDETHCRAERGNEVITIWWQGNSLIETPKHHYMGQLRSLHNQATATRQLAMKPEMKKVRRSNGARFIDLKLAPSGEAEIPEDLDIEDLRHELPFDPNESSDAEILKELRGSTIIFVNRISGMAESTHVARSLNMNLENFYLEDSVDGKTYVSFLSSSGFRSVYLDSILRVM